MNKLPLVSIVIPVYNEEKYLRFCLESLLNQTYKNIEIIVVDDGSTDGSSEIAKNYSVKVFSRPHRGLGATRNFGVNKAKGEILALLDGDMRYDKKYIEKLTLPIRKGEAEGTFNKEEYVANPENIWSRCWSINAGMPFNRRLPKDYKNQENAFRAIRKNTYLRGGGLGENYGYTEDSTLSKTLNLLAINATGAISYHFNPSTLTEVFYSSRWVGRSNLFTPSLANFFRFFPINSIRVSLKYLLKGAPIQILVFKQVFDLGMFVGVFLAKGNRAK